MRTVLLLFLPIGIATFLTRLSFIYLFDKLEIPPILRRGLKYIPPAVLTAIIFPDLFIRSGKIDISIYNPRLIAGLIAMLVAWKTKSFPITVAVGMISLWLTTIIIK